MGTPGYVNLVAELGPFTELSYLPEDARGFTDRLRRQDPALDSMGHWV